MYILIYVYVFRYIMYIYMYDQAMYLASMYKCWKKLGANNLAALICQGASAATSSLKGMQIRFASRAMATEAHAALLELLPTRI